MPHGPEESRRQARASFKAGRYDEAATFFEETIAAEGPGYPNSSQAQQDRVELGVALFRASRYADAARQFEAGTTADPRNANVQHKLGQAYIRMGQAEAALDAFRAAAQLAPDDAGYQWSYAEIALALGRRDEGEAALDATLAIDPSMPEARAARTGLTTPPGAGLATLPNENDFAGLLEFIRSRPAGDAPPRRAEADTSYRSLFLVSAGGLCFLVAYLYVRVVMLG